MRFERGLYEFVMKPNLSVDLVQWSRSQVTLKQMNIVRLSILQLM